jgi:hypothetical protein
MQAGPSGPAFFFLGVRVADGFLALLPGVWPELCHTRTQKFLDLAGTILLAAPAGPAPAR